MNEMQQQVIKYNELVKAYHLLDNEIDELLTKYGGHTENMPSSAMSHYRKLAEQRDEAFNMMRTLEQTLFAEDSE